MSVFHQVGHNSNWNVESLVQDKCGDGLVLSPVHQKRSQIEALDKTVRKRSLFDPQFYLPNSQKKNLSTYDFFPEAISGGFSTAAFPHLALDAAKGCVSFQQMMEFSALIIPARFDTNYGSPAYFDRQLEYTVEPFLKAIASTGAKGEVFLTLPILSAMLDDDEIRTGLLNWATSFPEVSGVYLLVAEDRSRKQIQSKATLLQQLRFASELRGAGLSVLQGHVNSESVPLCLVDGIDVTMGSFENTRMFSIDKFLESDEERRGPQPRIYLHPLLNWIQFGSAVAIRDGAQEIWHEIYEPTTHSELTMKALAEPHFSQPSLYKHHFCVLYGKLKKLQSLPALDRYKEVRSVLLRARDLYEQIQEVPIDLDPHGLGTHIQPWIDAVNTFYAEALKPSA